MCIGTSLVVWWIRLHASNSGDPIWSLVRGFPGGSDRKESACCSGVPGSIPGTEDALKKEMANHSTILAWKIPWMEEPGRLQSIGSQRVGMTK